VINQSSLQNNIRRDVVYADTINWKFGVLVGCGMLAALLSGYSFNKVLVGSDIGGVWRILFFSSLSLLLSGIVLKSLILKTKKAVLGVAILEFAMLALPFLGMIFNSLRLILLLVLFSLLYFVYAYVYGFIDQGSSLSIKFFGRARVVLGKAATGLVLFGVLGVFLVYNFKDFNITSQMAQNFIKPTTFIIGRYIPQFHPQVSVNDLIYGIVRDRYGIPEDTPQSAIDEVVVEVRGQLSEFLHIQLRGQEKLSEVLAESFNVFIKNAEKDRNTYFIGAAFLTLFLLIRGIAPLFNFIVALFAFLIYELLIAVNFIAVISEQKSKEVVLME